MRFWKRLRSLPTAIFVRARVESELDAELRFHVEAHAEDLMRAGLSREEALRQARLKLGGMEPTKEKCRDALGVSLVESLIQDVRFGLRMLRKNPGFTTVAVITLALGIGANTAIFSVVQSVLLEQLPYEHPDKLVEVWNTYLPRFPQFALSGADFNEWRAQAKSFAQMAAYWSVPADFNLTGEGEPARVEITYASSNLFSTLGVRPVVGRGFVAEEDRPGAPRIAMLSYKLWESRFGGDSAVGGRTLTLDGQNYTLVGVLPANLPLVPWADVWLPMGLVNPNELNTRVYHDFNVIARLATGATIQQAQTEMTTLEQRQAEAHPETNGHFMVNIAPLRDPEAVRMRGSLLALFVAVGMVLLIACANLVNLLLARNSGRQKEIAVRVALGATPLRVMRQLLIESVILSLMGGVLGLVFAGAALRVLKGLAPPELTDIRGVGLNLWVLTFTFVIAVVAGIVSGSLPARNSLRIDVNTNLKEGAKAAGSARGRVRDLLVVAEISLALVPLVGAGLLIRSFNHLLGVDPGFRADHLLTMQVSLPNVPQDQLSKMTIPQRRAFYQKQSADWEQMGDRIRALPGVTCAGGISVLPIATEERAASRFVIEGRPETEKAPRPVAEMRAVTPEYFSTMGIRLVQGRLLTPTDSQVPNTIISEKMARQFWPAGDAIGHRVNLCSLFSQPCWSSIVGVVSDVHQFGLNAPLTFDMYFTGGWTDTLVIRTSIDPASLVPPVREQIHMFDPALPISQILTMDQILSDSLSQTRFLTLLLGIFAALGLVLSAVGVYGVLSYTVGERRNEIGIRMAVGAKANDVIGLAIGHGMKLAAIGVVIGLAAALALTRLLSSLLYGVGATDPVTFGIVVVMLFGVTLIACWIPAWRASRVDPVVALRHE